MSCGSTVSTWQLAVARDTSGEHDIIGHGWVEIENNTITVAVHPRGAGGMLEPKEKRTYPLTDITSWRASGCSITYGSGRWACSLLTERMPRPQLPDELRSRQRRSAAHSRRSGSRAAKRLWTAISQRDLVPAHS